MCDLLANNINKWMLLMSASVGAGQGSLAAPLLSNLPVGLLSQWAAALHAPLDRTPQGKVCGALVGWFVGGASAGWCSSPGAVGVQGY
jgi:hypothetical protein